MLNLCKFFLCHFICPSTTQPMKKQQQQQKNKNKQLFQLYIGLIIRYFISSAKFYSITTSRLNVNTTFHVRKVPDQKDRNLNSDITPKSSSDTALSKTKQNKKKTQTKQQKERSKNKQKCKICFVVKIASADVVGILFGANI